MRQLTYTNAVNEAIRQEMQADPRVFVMGEDVRVGAFGLTAWLAEEFSDRVLNTPISEGAITGAAIGAATTGLRPIVDYMMASFTFLAFDQLINQASMLRYMTGGQVSVPAVFIFRYGSGGANAAQHSHSMHSMLMNVPGLKIVMPHTPYDAKGMMTTAIRDDNPVCLFIHGSLGRQQGEVPEEQYTVPFGKARIVREGSDVTVVATGGMIKKAEKVADEYSEFGIKVEIIDPRSLVPIDKETLFNSLAKTGRLVVVDETHRICGAASEICALVAEEAFDTLKAPVRRVCPQDAPIPYSPVMEKFVIPDEKRISKAIEGLLE